MNKQGYKVKIKVGDAEIDVEGAESGVVKIVEALSEVLRGSRKSPTLATTSAPSSIATPTPRTSPVDIRSLFEEKGL